MRIAIPVQERTGREAAVAGHFGRAETFAVVDTEEDAITFADHEGGHGSGRDSPPVTIIDAGAEVVLAGNLGRKALERLQSADIEVYRGAEGTVADALEAWEDGDLEAVDPSDVHGHDHEHGHGHDCNHSHGDCDEHEH
ncbi:MAG: NifB/NifX family molybdenum-iron cluster-binding protein [Halodesulfurarchaeum sp.]